jgi:hypothetical protein
MRPREGDSVIRVSVHVPGDCTTEMLLSVSSSPCGPRQQTNDQDESPTSRQRYYTRPATPTPSSRRTFSNQRESQTEHLESLGNSADVLTSRNDRRTAAASVSETDLGALGDPPVVNNALVEIGGPDPVYPRPACFRHPEYPLPMVARLPKRYYNIYRGLKIGVFYDIWYAHKHSFSWKSSNF